MQAALCGLSTLVASRESNEVLRVKGEMICNVSVEEATIEESKEKKFSCVKLYGSHQLDCIRRISGFKIL